MKKQAEKYAKSISTNKNFQMYLINAYKSGIKYGIEMGYFFEEWIKNNAIWIRTTEEMIYKYKEKEYTKMELFEYFIENLNK
jgi:hypothetical protein